MQRVSQVLMHGTVQDLKIEIELKLCVEGVSDLLSAIMDKIKPFKKVNSLDSTRVDADAYFQTCHFSLASVLCPNVRCYHQ